MKNELQLDREKKPASPDEVREFLKNLKSMLKNTSTQLIIKNNRAENYDFFFLYNISRKNIKETLLNLFETDFKYKTINDNPSYEKNELYIFGPKKKLTAADGNTSEEELYIKIDLKKEKQQIIVISFHRAKYSY